MKKAVLILVIGILLCTGLPSVALSQHGGGGGGHGGGGGYHGGGWHGGGGYHGYYGGWHGGWGGYGWRGGYYGPWGWWGWGGWPGWGYPYGYPYAYPYSNPYIYQYPYSYPDYSASAALPAPSAPQPSYWYYCKEANAYYPYVSTCPGGWVPVSPSPQGGQQQPNPYAQPAQPIPVPPGQAQ